MLRLPHSRKVLHSRSIPRVRIKNRFSPTISALIGTVRLSKMRYIDAVKLILQKSVPEEVHLVPIKRPSYASASALVFLSTFSLLSFESKEPFIEENHFNVPFDVTAVVTFFLYYFEITAWCIERFSVSSMRVSCYQVVIMGNLPTVRSIFIRCYNFFRKMKDSHMRHVTLRRVFLIQRKCITY